MDTGHKVLGQSFSRSSAAVVLLQCSFIVLVSFCGFCMGHSNIDSTRITWDTDDRKPYFEVSGLVPGMGYNVFLIAHNSKGRSNATILQVYTLKDPEKQTGELSERVLQRAQMDCGCV